MVQVLPVPALASSRVVPVGQRVADVEGVRSGSQRTHPLGAGEQRLPDPPGVRRPARRRPAPRRGAPVAEDPAGGTASASSPWMPNWLLRVGLPLALGGRASGGRSLAHQLAGVGLGPGRAPSSAAPAAARAGPRSRSVDQLAQPVDGAVVERARRAARFGPARSRPTAWAVQCSSGWRALSASRSTQARSRCRALEPGVAEARRSGCRRRPRRCR